LGNTAAIEPKTSFSVILCTRNREQTIGRAIQSVLAQDYPSRLFELIVIDNGSTDFTRLNIRPYLASTSIRVSCYLERQVGVSFARNLGATAAQRDYVAFLDDDAAAAPGWLAAFDAAVQQHGALVAGGRVVPVLEKGVEAPQWWTEESIRGLFGLDHNHFLQGQPIARIRWPLWLGGGNSVYCKKLWRNCGGFLTELGPSGMRRRIAEDIDLNVRLERANVPIYYVHEAVVQHVMTADRLTRRSILKKAYWAGRTNATADSLLERNSQRVNLRQLVRSVLRLPFSPEPARIISGCGIAHAAGYLLQARLNAYQERRDASNGFSRQIV
jgi:glycosyltransferase involved in cell wall biosynthesis